MCPPPHAIFLFLFILLFLHPSALSQPPFQCDDTFSFSSAGIAAAANLTNCRKLPALGAKLGWSLHNKTNATTAVTIVDIVFSAVVGRNGWIAWGVNPGRVPQMAGTRALVGIGQMDNGDGGPPGSPVVATYNITADARLGCQLRNSSVEFMVENVRSSYSAATGRMVVAARLRLPPVYNALRLNHVWQVGPATAGMVLLPHPQRLQNFDGVETLDLVTGRRVAHSNTFMRYTHGALSVMGWGIFMPIGIMVTRYFREFPFKRSEWFLLHSSFQISAYVVGTTAWGIGLALLGGSKYYNTIMGHRIIGILIFCLATIQMIALKLKPKRKDKYRKYWSIYHHFTGYLLLALTIVNIFKGFNILKPPHRWRWVYIGILSTIGCAVFVLESITWYKFWKQQRKDRRRSNAGRRELEAAGC